ncbi:hypothetical protein ABS768_04430 [Flavobacterium sp. ST-75]|uniref:Lipoprotein n=1 Tax=Flavobacterium rhizophilum TaxID=3163296 RepID=A0ABW8YAC7_9FLAO
MKYTIKVVTLLAACVTNSPSNILIEAIILLLQGVIRLNLNPLRLNKSQNPQYLIVKQ